MVLAVVAAALSGVADPADAQSAGAGYFSDDDGSVHEPALDALASQGVLAGIECGEALICPSEPLKRWEMAVWLVRVLDGADPGAPSLPSFPDVDYDEWWAPFVERLLEMGVTTGCSRDTLQYCPDSSVTRAQMATFLTRAFDLEPAPAAGFTDVSGSTHAADINALAAAGITAGCSRDTLQYCPDSSVTRAQMASFLARALGIVELPASVRFTAIDAGYEHTCGLRADHTISCWGANYYGQSDAPDGEFQAVSAGGQLSCAIRADRTVVCWGNAYHGPSDTAAEEFQSVSTGLRHACGLRIDRTITCWGANSDGQSDAPDGQFDAVTAGFGFSCASGDSGLACWGGEEEEEVPEGRLVTMSAGGAHVCGLRDDSTVTCWGADLDGQSDAPAGRFPSVSAGGEHTCGLHENHTIVCWGHSGSGRIDPPRGEFQAVSAGGTQSCGVRLNGTAVCWGDTADDRSTAPEGQFTEVSAGGRHTCGLRSDSRIACWGHGGSGRAYPAPGDFKGVAAGQRHTCALSADSTVLCWGQNGWGETEAPEGRFNAVTAGWTHSCGLRVDGTVVCWGETSDVEAVPEGRFIALSTGSHHSCGLRSDETIVCWGSDLDGATEAPDGQFKSMSAGSDHSCGLRLDETVICWGRNLWGETDSRAGEFDAVSAGGGHTCGIHKDGTVVCWGRNSRGQAQAPSGRFKTVTAGDRHSCGVRQDNAAVCWGSRTVARPSGVRSPYAEDRPDPAACRIFATPSLTSTGFPRHRSAAPTTGTVRVAVLFMDFPDAVAGYSTRGEASESLPYAERYLEEASYGALDIEFVPLHRWLRSEHEHAHYLVGSRLHKFDSEAARLADPYVDFSEYDILMTVLPSNHFSGGTALGSVITEEGVVTSTVRINAHSSTLRLVPIPDSRIPSGGVEIGAQSTATGSWGWVAAHELLHALGLSDLYPIGRSRVKLIDEPSGKLRFQAEFGIMGLEAYFLMDDDDARTHSYFPGTDGEALAWSRWQLGWLHADQVRCVTGAEARVALRPVASDPGTGTAMAAVPLTANEAIVIESRRSIGRDTSRLLEEGVLVYTVNASIATGNLPIKVVGVPDGGFPVLAVGESVTVRGYTITVVADDGESHTVTIAKVTQS